MGPILTWILGGFFGVLAIVGLFMAANAHDSGIYVMGIGLFVFGTLFDFGLVKQHYDRQEGQ